MPLFRQPSRELDATKRTHALADGLIILGVAAAFGLAFLCLSLCSGPQ